MAHWAKPGVKCVCIAGFGDWRFTAGMPRALPVKRKTYTVDQIGNHPNGPHISLVEVDSWNDRTNHQYYFSAEAFRPLVIRSQEQDMAIFRPILTTIGEDA